MSKSQRIEICGGIASGKTTLAYLLADGGECSLALEKFRENPFWKRFYERPDLFAYEKKTTCFIAQHTGEIKSADEARLVICTSHLPLRRLVLVRQLLGGVVVWSGVFAASAPRTAVASVDKNNNAAPPRMTFVA
jgi:hypothetical protein